ncbi:hypothetical protein ColLi_12690 [Colletotrichum liriopes]|uniref:Uncharacterized protein n=1 Tax=Colletotrichum liriopes TaxID=708192 RepID=A0AA37H0U3_9PEZI|nr:hypothetical protein ColLi_12690 [Colletotrichum liriopes]
MHDLLEIKIVTEASPDDPGLTEASQLASYNDNSKDPYLLDDGADEKQVNKQAGLWVPRLGPQSHNSRPTLACTALGRMP